jgi:hypothetical protein
MNTLRKVEGMFHLRKCAKCNNQFSSFVFSGDTDMSTDGLICLTQPETGEIFITTVGVSKESGDTQTMDRIIDGKQFRRSNVCASAKAQRLPSDVRFQQYLRESRPPAVKSRCVFCNEFEAVTQSSMTIKEYFASGKKVVVDDGLILER